ncbi:MAG TPA: extracellular solute-binding protein, partial [Candidatus Sulfotelmatobacter sp.]|nr:extracellular solute-binding protein [Candidatus Sulfotelmatobacter sp.]
KRRAGVSRREVLKAGLGVAALSALPSKAFAGQAPAFAKGTSLSILQGTYFVAPAQDLYKRQAEEWGKANGVTMSADFLNWPDLQPKIAAAIQAGGVDIVELWPSWNHLYKDNLVDMTEEAQAFAKRNGGFEKYVLNSAPVGNRYLGIPHGMSNASMNYRINAFKEAGVPNAEDGSKVDLTWDEYHEAAKKTKAKGLPFGQALGHSTGDPPGFVYPYMWAHGAMEVDKDGKSVQFNKPSFVDAMRKFIEYWKDGYDTTGTSWDDSSNNRAFLAGQLASTYNGSSIYISARTQNPKIAEDMHHMLIPKGPAGRFYWLGSRTFAILKNSKNVPAAKEFLKWWFEDKQYGDWWRMQEGYMLQAVTKYYNDPVWFKDKKMLPFREQPKYGVDVGWPGPPNEKASLAWSKYIVVDTFAKAVQSGDAKGSIEWGAEQLKRVYGV